MPTTDIPHPLPAAKPETAAALVARVRRWMGVFSSVAVRGTVHGWRGGRRGFGWFEVRAGGARLSCHVPSAVRCGGGLADGADVALSGAVELIDGRLVLVVRAWRPAGESDRG